MLKNFALATMATVAVAGLAQPLAAGQKNGAVAQDFKLTDMNGNTVQLSSFRGKTVVLEWHNPGCPFVKKHYDSGNMQSTQAAARKQGVVWLTINSGAPGKQGYMSSKQAQTLFAEQNLKASHYLLDRKGLIGKAYGARTTPHMYVIDGAGKLVYQGGIDDKPTANPADIKGARNHVAAALSDLKSGNAIRIAQSRAYGCSVKYAS
ncbi:thioredoxin family protein [Parasphingorhabdus sp.]|uniref:thioredoxin family protein n=1 Tax=Parasphingorhabdus sp. TaxID=2709688 RepID=UPI003266CBFC